MESNVGYNIDVKLEKQPENKDIKCPHTGETSVRGKVFEGTVVSDAMTRTVKVEWETLVRDKKYSRYYRTRSRVAAHNPDVIAARKGDKVLIGETRPLSKTKKFAVLKIINKAGEE